MEKTLKWYRIAELERESGTSRRTIHFYLQSGLLHPPLKTGKTMAYYDASHLNKLLFIRQAKETGMPLMAIHREIQNQEEDQPDTFAGHGGALLDEEKRPLRQKNPSNIKSKETRESIIELACRMFREKGYKETRVSDITKALQVGKGTFYFYFSDKKECSWSACRGFLTNFFHLDGTKSARRKILLNDWN